MSQAVKCLILLAVVALLFVTELIPLAIYCNGRRDFLRPVRFYSCKTGILGFIRLYRSLVCRYVRRRCFHVLHRSCSKNRRCSSKNVWYRREQLDVWLNDGRYGFIFLPVQYWYCSLPAASCARYLCRS